MALGVGDSVGVAVGLAVAVGLGAGVRVFVGFGDGDRVGAFDGALVDRGELAVRVEGCKTVAWLGGATPPLSLRLRACCAGAVAAGLDVAFLDGGATEGSLLVGGADVGANVGAAAVGRSTGSVLEGVGGGCLAKAVAATTATVAAAVRPISTRPAGVLATSATLEGKDLSAAPAPPDPVPAAAPLPAPPALDPVPDAVPAPVPAPAAAPLAVPPAAPEVEAMVAAAAVVGASTREIAYNAAAPVMMVATTPSTMLSMFRTSA